jgi:hypothetical protein
VSQVWQGDSWKRAADDDDQVHARPTRAQAQAMIDRNLAMGRISRAEWRRLFDQLSDLKLWTAEGRTNYWVKGAMSDRQLA